MASTYLTRTNGTPTNAKKWTVSFWVKCDYLTPNAAQDIYFVGTDGQNEVLPCRLDTDGKIYGKEDAGGSTPWSYLVTNQLFRDVSGWYHIVQTYDSTLATSSDRLKMWVNGIDLFSTSGFTSTVYPSQNHEPILTKSGYTFDIGRRTYDNANYFYGSLSHFHLTDGYTYQASDFGEYDANGVWKIKTSPSVTYGNNGFFILKDGNSVTDQSGNGNNFTVGGGTLTNTEDSPSNVFATLNTLFTGSNNFTFENGNTTVTTSVSDYKYAISTLGMSSGKYYVEVKNVNHPSNPNNDHYNRIGIASGGTVPSSLQYLGVGAYEYGIREDNGNVSNNNGSTAYGVGYSTDGDIVGCALDLDNNKIYWSKNGTWMNSADPSAGTGGFSITAPASTDSGFYHFAVGEGGSSLSSKFSINFGNGYFGTTPVASAGTNASGNGIFEYDVPTGYTALSTKGLNL